MSLKYLIIDDKYSAFIAVSYTVQGMEIMDLCSDDVIYKEGFSKWLQFLDDWQ